MNLRLGGALAAALLLVAAPTGGPASAQVPPSGSPNVTHVASVPQMVGAIALAFIGNTMFVTTPHGLYSFDVADPEHPSLLRALPMYIWENEDMDVDPSRDLVFISRDPRGFTSPAVNGFPYAASAPESRSVHGSCARVAR